MSEKLIKLTKNAHDNETGQAFTNGQELAVDEALAGRLIGGGVAEELAEEDAQEQPVPVPSVAGSGSSYKPAKVVQLPEEKKEDGAPAQG